MDDRHFSLLFFGEFFGFVSALFCHFIVIFRDVVYAGEMLVVVLDRKVSVLCGGCADGVGLDVCGLAEFLRELLGALL